MTLYTGMCRRIRTNGINSFQSERIKGIFRHILCNIYSVMLACPASFFTIPNKSEGFQTSWNDGICRLLKCNFVILLFSPLKKGGLPDFNLILLLRAPVLPELSENMAEICVSTHSEDILKLRYRIFFAMLWRHGF
jgi:hypothetical protein